MNLDEIIQYFKEQTQKELNGISAILSEWKITDETVTELSTKIETYFANIYFEDTNKITNAFNKWIKFISNAIDSINGMTMNERLYWLSLLERFDKENDIETIYRKLNAKT